MDGQTTGQPDVSPAPDYERLCIELYNYRFGAISFLELIERLEVGLGLSHQTEGQHLDSALYESERE